jgi:lantibiotic modifying enzyme
MKATITPLALAKRVSFKDIPRSLIFLPYWFQACKKVMDMFEKTVPQVLDQHDPYGTFLTLFSQLSSHLDDLIAPSVAAVFAERKEDRSDPSSEKYKLFFKEQANIDFFKKKHSLVMEQVTLSCEQFCSNLCAFVNRFSSNFSRIMGFVAMGNGPMLSSLDELPADPHHGGGRPLVLTFLSGLEQKKLVYKLRGRSCWKFLNMFISGCKVNLPMHEALIPDDDGEYYFCEFVEHTPCSKEEVGDFYFNFGKLLGIAHAAGLSDLHSENVIARGASPILVDIESLLVPSTALDSFDQLYSTGLIQKFPIAFHATSCDFLSALQQPSTSMQTDSRMAVLNDHTDCLRVDFSGGERAKIPSSAVFYFSNGLVVRPTVDMFAVNVCSGYEETISQIKKYQEALIQQCLSFISSVRSRVIIRDTQTYITIGNRRYVPAFQACIRKLLRKCLEDASSSLIGSTILESVIESEVDSLLMLDIPLFYAQNGKLLDSFGEVVVEKDAFLGDFSLKDRIDQVTDQANLRSNVEKLLKLLSLSLSPPNYIVEDCSFVNCARYLLEDCIAASLSHDSSFRNSPSKFFDGKVCNELSPFLRLNFYDGLGGVMLTVGAAFSVLQEMRYFDAAQELAKTIYKAIDSSCTNIGGCYGIGSLCYCYAASSVYLKDNSFLQIAFSIAKRINLKMIEQDSYLDIIQGSAGCVLGLTSIVDANVQLPSALSADQLNEIINLALAVGNHVEKCFSDLDREEKLPLEFPCGFSHGLSGIIRALFKLSQFTNKFDQLFQKLVRLEDSFFDQKSLNWPQFRVNESFTKKDMWSWCHGAPGVILSRLEWWNICDRSVFCDLLENVIQQDKEDSICCGTFGSLETLFALSRSRGEDQLTKWIQRAAVSKIRIQNFGFFQGKAGIAFQILHHRFPEVSTAIMFEIPKVK